ncbi:MAG: hypothetical protein HY909_18735 [Deltaproteobacteria bacterium]|nr:hypothetical protein [Deltaproteobacteria bacterium]
MARFPEILPDDPDEVVMHLEVSQGYWLRGEAAEAVKGIRRAAEAAFDLGADARGLLLSKAAGELAQGGPRQGPPGPPGPTPRARPSNRPPPMQKEEESSTTNPRVSVPGRRRNTKVPKGQEAPRPQVTEPARPPPPRPAGRAPMAPMAPSRRDEPARVRSFAPPPPGGAPGAGNAPVGSGFVPPSPSPPGGVAAPMAPPAPASASGPPGPPGPPPASLRPGPPRRTTTEDLGIMELNPDEITEVVAQTKVAAAFDPSGTLPLPMASAPKAPTEAAVGGTVVVPIPMFDKKRSASAPPPSPLPLVGAVRVAVSRGPTGLLVRTREGALREGEVEAVLLGTGNGEELLRLFRS